MCGVKCITFMLWIYIHSVITGENNSKMVLTPLQRVIHVGEDLEITCRVTDCPVNVTFMWTSAGDQFLRAEIKNEHTVSQLLIRNISVTHSETVVCTTKCDGRPLQQTSNIKIFSFPEDPVLPKIESLIANQEKKLICTVHNIYPLEMFHIEWFRGDKSLQKEELYSKNSDHVQNYSSVFNYTPSVDDLGKNISCKATLNLNDWNKTTTAEYGPGTVTVSSNNTMVKLGDHLEITCHADGNPKPTILWWKLGVTEPEQQSQNHKLIISNASWSQAGWYRCNASNNVGSQQMSVNVIVVGPPNTPKIQLSHGGELKEGENLSIFCSSDGRPAELKLYRQSQTAATGVRNESAVLLNFSSIQITDAGIYICEAKNDFGTESSTMNITVKAQHSISRNPDLPVAILPAVGSVSLLTAAGLLIRHCRKQARSNISTIL